MLLLIQYKQVRSKQAQHCGQNWKEKEDWFIFSCLPLSKLKSSCIGRVISAKGSNGRSNEGKHLHISLIQGNSELWQGWNLKHRLCGKWIAAFLGCNGKGKWFPWFSESTGALPIWHSLREGRGGLEKGSVVWGLQRLADLRILWKKPFCEWLGQRLSSSLCLPWGICWCQTTAPVLTSARQRVGPTSTKWWSNLELSLYLSFSPRLCCHTGF